MQKPRGTKDVFGEQAKLRLFVFEMLKKISITFNLKPIEVPIFEFEDVFARSMGQTSDVVSKEMYHFQDRSGRKLVLRPEGTAGIVRAIVMNKLYASSLPLKLFYFGPMFRYENPQQGRQRQFTQYGVEVLSPKSPYLDAEVVLMAATILDTLKIDYILKINSLGDQETRDKWSNALRNYFKAYENELEPLSIKRLEKNPARILDDKIELQKKFVKKAPQIAKFYSQATKKYFREITTFLKQMGIKLVVDHSLVRGFDYYNDFIFEFLPKRQYQSSQSTIIGGGRYDHLVADFGGPKLSGVGFAVGIERLMSEMPKVDNQIISQSPEVYICNLDEAATPLALSLAYLLRRAGFYVAWNYRPKHLNKVFEKADKLQATIKIIVGKKEIESGNLILKWNQNQKKVTVDNLTKEVEKILAKGES